MGLTIVVNILGEHVRPKGNTCHSNSLPPHSNLRNFLNFRWMGTWRKASLMSIPQNQLPDLSHCLIQATSSILKEIFLTEVLKRFRLRMGLHLSGDLFDLGTAKYELTY